MRLWLSSIKSILPMPHFAEDQSQLTNLTIVKNILKFIVIIYFFWGNIVILDWLKEQRFKENIYIFFKGRNMGFLFVFICLVFLHVIIYYCFWGLTKKKKSENGKIVRGGGKLYLWAQLDHSGTQLASTAADTQLASPFLLFLILFLNLKSSCLQM